MVKKTKIIVWTAILVIVIITVYFIFFRKQNEKYTLVKVVRGDVVQEISESGAMQKGEDVNLNFKTSGKIEQIFVNVGDEVAEGQKLAKLDTAQLYVQLAQAQANAQAQRARLAELQREADATLNSYYDDTPAVLNQAYNLADSAVREQIKAMFIYRTEAANPYFELTYKSCNSQAKTDSESQRMTVEGKLNSWRSELQNLTNGTQKLDEALFKAENYLKTFQSFLNKLNDTLGTDCKFTPDELTRINTHKPIVISAITNLNTALNSVLTQKQLIDDQKLTVQNYISNKEQINYQQALVNQAEAGAALLQEQIKDATLKSPIDGQIAQINKEAGEQILVTENLIVLLPKSPFQAKADIYEEDIVKVQIGDPVEIKLTAFSDQVFKGKVISTDPASKLIEGVVYYGVMIDFQEPPSQVRPGMTADVTIKTDFKENVLTVPKSAVAEKDGKTFVQILKNGKIEERQIQIGLEGTNDLVEVISGLQEGEEVILEQ